MRRAGHKQSWWKMKAVAQNSWMETSGLWLMLHREQQGLSQASHPQYAIMVTGDTASNHHA